MSENNTTPDRPDNPNGGTLAEILFSRGYLDSAGYHLEEAIREMTRGAAEQENKEWLGLQRKRYSIEDGFLKEHELSKQDLVYLIRVLLKIHPLCCIFFSVNLTILYFLVLLRLF